MIQILRKQLITIIFLLLGGIIGLVLYSKQKAVAIWYVQYQYRIDQGNDIAPTVSQDTLFKYNGILVRNFTASKADTVRNIGIIRQELKVYGTENQTELEITLLANKALNDPTTSIANTIFFETQRKKRVILYALLIGFFVGMIFDFIRAMKKKPNSKNQGD
ncbi:MAG: hypothetical protein ACI837_001918 [Crocinitomicaceae bacterium]|jgi:hypothetical protein